MLGKKAIWHLGRHGPFALLNPPMATFRKYKRGIWWTCHSDSAIYQFTSVFLYGQSGRSTSRVNVKRPTVLRFYGRFATVRDRQSSTTVLQQLLGSLRCLVFKSQSVCLRAPVIGVRAWDARVARTDTQTDGRARPVRRPVARKIDGWIDSSEMGWNRTSHRADVTWKLFARPELALPYRSVLAPPDR